MYYEEKVINGVLHWRSSPDGEWTMFTLERLTMDVVDLRAACRVYQERMERAKKVLDGEDS